AIRNAEPLPTTTIFTRMPVCCSNAGVNLAAAPELTNEVVTATRSVDSAAGAAPATNVAAAAHASSSSRAAWTRVTTVRRIAAGRWRQALAKAGACRASRRAILQRDSFVTVNSTTTHFRHNRPACLKPKSQGPHGAGRMMRLLLAVRIIKTVPTPIDPLLNSRLDRLAEALQRLLTLAVAAPESAPTRCGR